MQKHTREISHFFYSQAFADGFRITFAILLPALTGFYAGAFELGMSISLGALCVSLTDAPGPIIHKRNGMLICAAFLFIVALITPLARLNTWTMGAAILAVSFFFSMFSVYGNRATSVGNAAVLVMILTMDKHVDRADILPHAALICSGGIWYLVISLLFHNLQPYRAAQRSLGASLREVSAYLLVKSDFYDPSTDLNGNYRRLVAQQIVVNEKQDAVREILFKTRQIVAESTPAGRKLVWTFVETVDLFEDATATYYDYAALRQRFGDTGLLEKISAFIKTVARELDEMGITIEKNSRHVQTIDLEAVLRGLKEEIDAFGKDTAESQLVLKKILVNLRRLVQRTAELNQYFAKKPAVRQQRASLDHSHFVTHQPLDPRIIWNNLTLQSSVFRHAARVSLSCITGYAIVKTFSYGNHSYWVLLTIAFILKPAFSLTKQRNIQRILGTVIGGGIGVLILVFIPNKTAQFVLMVLLMIGNYSFMRINYLAMVLCVTPFVLILFNFLGVPFGEVARERIADTIVGCAIAFSASYFLFPTWESEGLSAHLRQMLKADADYLEIILGGLKGGPIGLLEYKLVRKEVYVSSANLTSAFQRMLSEPKGKQRDTESVHQFVVLSHILFSNIATVATTLLRREPREHPDSLVLSAERSLRLLQETAQPKEIILPVTTKEELAPDDRLLKDQLDFIYKVSTDLSKTRAALVV